MRSRLSLHLALAPLVLSFAAACGSTDAPAPPADAGTVIRTDAGAHHDGSAQPDPDAGPETDGSAVADGAVPEGPGATGVVLHEEGAPVANGMVLGCTVRFCLFGSTDGDGRFAFMFDPPATMIVKTPEDDTATPRRAEGIQPIEVSDHTLVDVGTVWVPTLPAGAILGPPSADPRTVQLGDGLELTVRRADLQAPVGKRTNNLAARSVAPAHQPRFSALAGEELVAVYALYPFATVSRSPIGVRVASTLPAGTVVKLRTVDELDGHLSDPVLATADGAYLATAPGTGITKVSWLLISR